MSKARMKNLHVPLPEPMYRRLRAEAERTKRPATDLAREAIDGWLEERHRRMIHESIVEYANAVAGTNEDLDSDLEAASVDRLLAASEESEEVG